MEIPDWLTRRAAGMPDAPAVVGGAETWSWSELQRRSDRLARQIAGHGIGAGDRVAVLMGNGLPYVTVIHALIKCRAILVPLNTRLTIPELAWQVSDVQARLLLYDTGHLQPAQALAPTGVTLVEVLSSAILENEPLVALSLTQSPRRESHIDLDATHSIIYTSGTTGKPKGVLLTYGNHWWSALGSALNLGLHAGDRWLAVLPLFHVGGLSIVLRGVIYGMPIVVHERFVPEHVNRALDHEHVTIVSAVATMLARMLDVRADRPYPSTVRAVLLGGGPAPRPLLERCAAAGVPVVQTYGMTETASQVATLPLADARRKLGSAGRPLLPVELRIEAEGRELPPATVGEIVVRGPNVTPGYADRPDATAAAMVGGWLHTGDLGYLDHEGYLYVVDRRDDLIISGGENIYPAEVEAVLLAHPAVAEAGVVGLPDPRWGQQVAAAAVLRPDSQATAAELIDFCSARLARYKVPGRLIFMSSLPRNAGGKLMRHILREAWPSDQAEGKPG